MSTEFSEKLPALWKKIGSHGVMVLSTCAGNRVTSRPVSVVVLDGRFYFQTDENYLKYKQLSENENAALSVKNFSIEGKCKDIGRPADSEAFTKAMKKYFLPAYMNYSKLESERVLEFVPALIYSWSYELAKPYMEYWDFENFTYKKECKYDL